jgi:hypothetical protein
VTGIPAAAELARLRAGNPCLLRMLERSPSQAALPGAVQAGFFLEGERPVLTACPPRD